MMLSACSSAPRDGIQFEVSPHKDDARISIQVQDDRAIVEVVSASGIGGAHLEITSPRLPRQIIMRFHLRGLEELRFSYDDAVITASISSTKDHAIHQSFHGTGALPATANALTPGDPNWMSMRLVPAAGVAATLPLEQGYIEVEAPELFLRNKHRRMTLHWIDFYR